MTRSFGLALIAAFAIIPLSAHDCCDHGAYHHGWWDCEQQGQHCWRQPAKAIVETLQGTVAEVNGLSDSDIVEIWLKSAKNTTLVRLAPQSFLQQNGFNLKPGDSLSVTGYWAGRDSEFFIARDVQVGGKSLVLRGEHGRPAW
ncbi:MAG TPA: hypothetical protein VMT32_02670 [Bryobacteraceae bacterium]|nr:hypothetical protein [Bryobacteraceae bacterium]